MTIALAQPKQNSQTSARFEAKVDPESLIKSMQAALLNAHDFATKQTGPTTYVISEFSLQLKTVVSQEAGKTVFILPSRPGEIDPNLMSTAQITIRPVPHNIGAQPGHPPSGLASSTPEATSVRPRSSTVKAGKNVK